MAPPHEKTNSRFWLWPSVVFFVFGVVALVLSVWNEGVRLDEAEHAGKERQILEDIVDKSD